MHCLTDRVCCCCWWWLWWWPWEAGGGEVFIAESRMPLHPRSSWNVSCVSFFAPSCCSVVSDPVVGVGLLTAIRFVVGGRHPQSAYQNARLRTHKDVYLPVTFKCAQEFVLVTFCSYSAFTNSTHRYKPCINSYKQV